jgi:hypothetical protein
MIAVHRTDDDELDRLRGNGRDCSNQLRGVVDGSLSVGDQHPLTCHDNQVVHRDAAFRRIDVLVGVDPVSEPSQPRQIVGSSGLRRNHGRCGQRDDPPFHGPKHSRKIGG